MKLFQDYQNCKPPKNKENKIGDLTIDPNFERPANMNTFKHFLGFRNPILCTIKMNFAEGVVTFGKFKNLLRL